jgi:hypothetical protein
LDALVEAFARGDYGAVRTLGRKLSAAAPDEEVRAAAQTVVAHTEPDPLAVALLLLAGALLIALSAYWIIHGKPPSGGVPTSLRGQSKGERTP